jgi:sulfate transport system substrate-binding protein
VAAKRRRAGGKIFQNVPVLDAGGRGATTTFTQREIGDVLVTFENEVQLVKQEYGDRYDVVYPRYSVLAESPVALVDKVADKLGTALRQVHGYSSYTARPDRTLSPVTISARALQTLHANTPHSFLP